MKIKLKIFMTNWVNLVGIFLAAYLFTIITEIVKLFPNKLTSDEILNSLFVGFLGGLFGILGYGLIFWLGFLLAIFLLDMILMSPKRENLRIKLLFEWIAISIPFVYWGIQYTEWIWFILVLCFLLTQLLREKKIQATLSPMS